MAVAIRRAPILTGEAKTIPPCAKPTTRTSWRADAISTVCRYLAGQALAPSLFRTDFEWCPVCTVVICRRDGRRVHAHVFIRRCGGCTCRLPADEAPRGILVPPADLRMRSANSFLVVARDIDVQDLYVLSMREHRVSVLGVSTCEEAVRASRLARFGAVLFDVESRDDWASLAALRKRLPLEVPIVVLTGWLAVDRTYRNLAQQLGCAGFVAKPASSTLVARALRCAAEGSPWSEYVDVRG